MSPLSQTMRKTFATFTMMFLGLQAAWAALPIEQWALDNGAKIYLVRSPGLPMLDVQIDVDGGSRRDPADQAVWHRPQRSCSAKAWRITDCP